MSDEGGQGSDEPTEHGTSAAEGASSGQGKEADDGRLKREVEALRRLSRNVRPQKAPTDGADRRESGAVARRVGGTPYGRKPSRRSSGGADPDVAALSLAVAMGLIWVVGFWIIAGVSARLRPEGVWLQLVGLGTLACAGLGLLSTIFAVVFFHSLLPGRARWLSHVSAGFGGAAWIEILLWTTIAPGMIAAGMSVGQAAIFSLALFLVLGFFGVIVVAIWVGGRK